MESNHLPKGTGLRPAAPPWSERGRRIARASKSEGASKARHGAHVRNRTGSSRVRGGCSTDRAARARCSRCARCLGGRHARRRERMGEFFVRVNKPLRCARVRNECLTVWLAVRALRLTALDSNQHVLACVASSSGRRSSSGRNRTFESPVNSRLPDHSASLEYALVASVRAAADSTSPISCEAGRRSGQRARTRRALAPSCQRARDLSRERAAVPGTGFEPVFLASETSVLPLDDPGAVTASARRLCCVVRRSGRSGGNRTLTTPIKSRVRFRLRYGPVSGDEREARAGQTCPHPRESR